MDKTGFICSRCNRRYGNAYEINNHTCQGFEKQLSIDDKLEETKKWK